MIVLIIPFFSATVPVCVNSSRYGGGGKRAGGGGWCVCDHLRQRGSGKGLLMMSVIHILIGSHYRAS